jgi:hypothetical protein
MMIRKVGARIHLANTNKIGNRRGITEKVIRPEPSSLSYVKPIRYIIGEEIWWHFLFFSPI